LFLKVIYTRTRTRRVILILLHVIVLVIDYTASKVICTRTRLYK
jgi:hypothetical protein